MIKKLKVFLTMSFLLILSSTKQVFAQTSNLIQNASVEESDTKGNPVGWAKGRWGTNQTVFTYPVSGFESLRAAKVDILTHTTGDAKWYFTDVTVTAGKPYKFYDYYISNIGSYVTARYKLTSGNYKYIDLAILPPSDSWQKFEKIFTVPNDVTSLTIFHLINKVGSLTVDNYNLAESESDPNKFLNGIVSLNFDDGLSSIYRNAIPILNNANLKSTQYIVTNFLVRGSDYVNSQQVLEMQSQGHEIGAHTRTHPNLTLLSEEQITNEIVGSLNDLITLGANVSSFAYPYGAYNSTTDRIVKDAGFTGARTSNGGVNNKNSDRYTLRRYSIRNTTTLSDIQNAVEKTLQDKTWLILLFHGIENSGDTYSMTPELFQQAVDYLVQRGVRVLTNSQVLQLMLN